MVESVVVGQIEENKKRLAAIVFAISRNTQSTIASEVNTVLYNLVYSNTSSVLDVGDNLTIDLKIPISNWKDIKRDFKHAIENELLPVLESRYAEVTALIVDEFGEGKNVMKFNLKRLKNVSPHLGSINGDPMVARWFDEDFNAAAFFNELKSLNRGVGSGNVRGGSYRMPPPMKDGSNDNN